MTVSLGSSWIARELPPSDAVLERDPMTAALLNLQDLLEQLIMREQTPIRVEAPPIDLSSLTSTLATFAPPDAAAIARAISDAIVLPQPEPQDTTALEALLAAMEKLDFRMRGTGGGGSLSPDITDRASRQLGIVSTVSAGTFGYTAGVSGTEILTGGKRVQNLSVHCTSAGSLTINGGAAIPIPANSQFSTVFADGKLTDPTIIMTGSDSYYIDFLS
jgi:hypothetical protein